jgi:hypothetical protein
VRPLVETAGFLIEDLSDGYLVPIAHVSGVGFLPQARSCLKLRANSKRHFLWLSERGQRVEV